LGAPGATRRASPSAYAGGGIIIADNARLGRASRFLLSRPCPASSSAALAFSLHAARARWRGAMETTRQGGSPKTAQGRTPPIPSSSSQIPHPPGDDHRADPCSTLRCSPRNAFWLPTYLQRKFEMSGKAPPDCSAVASSWAGGLIGIPRRRLESPTAVRLQDAQGAPLEVGIVGLSWRAAVLIRGSRSSARLSPPLFVSLLLLTVVCLYLYQGPFTAVAQNVVSPGTEGRPRSRLLLFISTRRRATRTRPTTSA